MCWLGCTASAESTAHGSTGAEYILSLSGSPTNLLFSSQAGTLSNFFPDYYPDQYCPRWLSVEPFFQFNECILLFSDMPAVDIDNVVSTSMEVGILYFSLILKASFFVSHISLSKLFKDQMQESSMMLLKVFTSTPASLTWREHDSGDRKTGPLHISPLPVKTLKEEKVVYIGGNSLALFSGGKD